MGESVLVRVVDEGPERPVIVWWQVEDMYVCTRYIDEPRYRSCPSGKKRMEARVLTWTLELHASVVSLTFLERAPPSRAGCE